MSSEISGLTAIVIGSSGGIGGALARRLAQDGRYTDVHTIGGRRDGLDVTDEASVLSAAKRLGETRADLIFHTVGVLAPPGESPEKSFAAIDPAAMARAFAVNTIGAALVLKHFGPLLGPTLRPVFALLSARVGSVGDNRLGGWMSYRASKAALNQIVRCAAVEYGRVRPGSVVVALHPGTVDTGLSRPFAGGRSTITPDHAATQLLQVVDGLTGAQSGGFFANDGSVIPW